MLGERLLFLLMDSVLTGIPAFIIFKIARLNKPSWIFALFYLLFGEYLILMGLVGIVNTLTCGIDGKAEKVYWWAAQLLMSLPFYCMYWIPANVIITLLYFALLTNQISRKRQVSFKSPESILYFFSSVAYSVIAVFYLLTAAFST